MRVANANNFIASIRFDEMRLNSATAQFSPAIRDIVGAVTRVVESDKKRKEIAG